MSKRLRIALAGGMVLIALCSVTGLALFLYPTIYNARIYPGVSVRNAALGGLTVDEATSLLIDTLPDAREQTVELQGNGKSWEISWADVGRGYDCAGTAKAAYHVARDGPWHIRLLTPWRVRLRGRSVEPVLYSADADRVQAQVDAIARQVLVPPSDAALNIDSTGVTCRRGEAGRALDVETTQDRLITALSNGITEMEIATVVVPPDLREPEPGCTHAQSLLAQPFVLTADDPLTDYQASFEVPPERMVTWLGVVPVADGIVLEVEEGPVEDWLHEIAPELGAERVLDVKETLQRTVTELREGEHQARPAIQHPEKSYVVQPGDTLFDIAYNQGFPQWRLEEANPDVEPSELLIGMELTIPSIDVLFPEPLVPGKRIEIDLPEQRLRAYENDELTYDFTCSSGMTSTPTIAGQFQVLFKEPEAYAQRWSLEMPYFMAIYYEAPDFANGIHELPIRSNGQRLWTSVLGWPASYGCIILNVGDAEKLYNWAPVGTLVRIEGVAPGTPAYVPTYDEEAPGG